LKLTPQKFINLVSAHKNGKTTEFAQVIAAYNAYPPAFPRRRVP